MSTTYDCRTDQRQPGVDAAVAALQRGGLIVLPTDTVYGIAADAFNAQAVGKLLEAKGRGRDMPTPVLVPSLRTLDGLAEHVTPQARALAEAFWPGALTLVVRHPVTLSWDLGETRGTVALRMPMDPTALAVLALTGPLAVSSANRSGLPPATDAAEAARQLGLAVDVYLDGGSSGEPVPSTIVDLTGDVPVVRRQGAVSLAELRGVLPEVQGADLDADPPPVTPADLASPTEPVPVSLDEPVPVSPTEPVLTEVPLPAAGAVEPVATPTDATQTTVLPRPGALDSAPTTVLPTAARPDAPEPVSADEPAGSGPSSSPVSDWVDLGTQRDDGQ